MHRLGNELEVCRPIIVAGESVVANEVREYRCLHIGDIVGKYESNGKPDNNEVLLRVAFGHTQLKVTAEFVVEGEKTTNARFDLLT